MRSLLALRGMFFVMDSPRSSPLRSDLHAVLAPVLDTPAGPRILAMVAALVGYHSRVLSLEARDFLHLTEAASEAIGRSYKNAGPEEAQRFSTRVRQTLDVLGRTFDVSGDETRERVRRLCGLLRFVDAIDVDRTRLPPRFVREAARPTARNLREYLKRELIRTVAIHKRVVQFGVSLPAPAAETMASLRTILLADGAAPGMPLTFDQVREPWAFDARTHVQSLQQTFDAWLEKRWEAVLARPGALSIEEKRQIAIVTALTVAGEVLEEYSAIEVCDLTGIIGLGRFEWNGAEPFDGRGTVLDGHVVTGGAVRQRAGS
jgi:hypothetical protein